MCVCVCVCACMSVRTLGGAKEGPTYHNESTLRTWEREVDPLKKPDSSKHKAERQG